VAQAAAPVRRKQRPKKVARAPAAARSARHFDLVPASPRVRELRAMRSLQLAIAQSEATYELARRALIEFEEYLGAAKSRLRAAGYLVYQ